jgi:hypothetical protein
MSSVFILIIYVKVGSSYLVGNYKVYSTLKACNKRESILLEFNKDLQVQCEKVKPLL